MFTKIQAAEIAFTFGCDTIIMKGNLKIYLNFVKNKKGTLFETKNKKKKVILRIGWVDQLIFVVLLKLRSIIKALKNGASYFQWVRNIVGKFSKETLLKF